MIDFTLSSEQELIKETAKDFANTHLLPGVIERDEDQKFPKDEIKKMGELGFMGMMIPEKWGGSGFDTVSYVIAIEEIAAVELATSTVMSVNNSLVCQVLLDWGNDAQKNDFLVPLASGKKLGAYSLSEPQSGSDASNMRTFAEKDGNNYVVNGTKNWVTSGQSSDLIIFFCLTDKGAGSKGISAFIVEKGTPGLKVGKKENKLGLRASDTCELYFDNCKISKGHLIGDEGQGFSIAMKALGGGRIGIAAQSIGLARSALEKALNYSKERKQFGKPIGNLSLIHI